MRRSILLFCLMICLALCCAAWGAAMGEEPAEEEIENVFFDDPSEEDPAAGYIHQVLYGQPKTGTSRSQRQVGASLTGANAILYSRLRSDIAQVAAGNRASTVFKYPVADIHAQVTFTAEDLALETLAVDGVLTWEAETAAKQKMKDYNAVAVVYSLLADCPYELYWYNKATGGGCAVAAALPCTLSDDGLTVTVGGYLKFSMAVSEAYAAAAYTVDTSYGQAVAAAVSNAREIVEQYESCPDYDRLLGYKNAICDLTDYNYAAAEGAPYGNPWQLIWVFDGDETTNVVCEGYAKAFQYLNDLSSSKVTVISTQGTVNGKAHMWNVVAMDNGRNYLVDVTNCDTRIAGCYSNRLFLAGYASGSVEEGYRMRTGSTYVYTNHVFTVEELTLSSWDYVDAWPDTPACVFSASRGYVGYQMAILLNEDADGIVVRETGEEIPCLGRIALLPMSETGTFCYTIAAMRDGLTSDYGETLSLEVLSAVGGAVLSIPDGTELIEEEAFRGIGASRVRLPASVKQIGAYAFADNENLLLVEWNGGEIDATAFDGCPLAVLCLDDPNEGAALAMPFLVKEK